MDHDTAVRDRMAERYLLGELPAEERESFEEHFFACAECGYQVRAGAIFAANLRALGRAEAVGAGPRSGLSARLRWPVILPVAAAIALGAMAFYQGVVVIPTLRESLGPQLIASTALRGTTRGAQQQVRVSEGQRFFQLAFDVNADRQYSEYECEVLEAAGPSRFSVRTRAEGSSTTLHLLVPASSLSVGGYVVVVYGVAGSARHEVDRYAFTLIRSDQTK